MANQEGNFGYTRDLSGLYDTVVALSKEYLIKYEKRESKVIEFHTPDEISRLVDLSLPEEGLSDEDIIEQCKSVLRYSVHTAHPHCYNQLWSGGVDQVGLLGQLLTSTVHTLMYTFEMAPVFTVMEAKILQELRAMIGYTNGEGDGIFTPGGSLANLYGLITARYYKFRETKKHGIVHLPRLVFFASEHSHYSNLKSAFVMGLGTESVIAVKCDEKGKMDPGDLDKKAQEAKQKGYAPFAVVATSGTTVLGAYDPIGPIADVCQKYDLWLHVDAAYGGGCLITEKYRYLMSGCERADSITWDLHKSFVVPQQCSAILLKHKGLLAESNSTKASYLFQKDKQNYDVSFDTGDKSIQCGRVNDVFKLWLMWKAKGRLGFARQMENSIELAKSLAQKINANPNFELILEPEYTNVCFWYIPPSLQGTENSQERRDKLNSIAPKIKAKLVEAGTLMIGYQPLDSYPNFFRMVTTAPQCKETDMDHLLNEIERFGKSL